MRGDRYEVLNFGISNFGVGQYLLVWEHYVRRFAPDYVFVFVAGLQMDRTVSKFEMGGFDSSRRKHLSVRPVFRLEGDRLILEKARDFDEFVKVQHDLVQKEFHGSRMRKRQAGFVLGALPSLLNKGLQILQRRLESAGNLPPERIVDEGTVRVNLKIIERLNQSVRKTGGKLIVVDAVRYLGGAKKLSYNLRNFCMEQGLGYVPLSDDLLAANREGTSTRWRYDLHFNEAGNRLFADAMYRWVIRDAEAGEASRLRVHHGP